MFVMIRLKQFSYLATINSNRMKALRRQQCVLQQVQNIVVMVVGFGLVTAGQDKNNINIDMQKQVYNIDTKHQDSNIDIVLSVKELLQMVEQRPRSDRQLKDGGGGEVTFQDIADIDTSEEKRCIEKVILEQETEWEEEITCHHRYRSYCFTTFSTAFNPIQEKECQDHYIKNCFIEYGVAAVNDTVRVCRRPMVKDCNIQGEEICSTQYETECWTRNLREEIEDDFPDCKSIVEQVCSDEVSGYTSKQKCQDVTRLVCEVKQRKSTKFVPVTECAKIPVQVCAPAGCQVIQGPEECHDKTGLVVFDKPEESCDLAPFKKCDFVTKLVPYLKETGKCIDVPLEVCVRQQRNPRKVDRPIIKIWCYKLNQ